MEPKTFERQYKDHLSDFHEWNQKDHADEWLVFSKNIGTHLSLDETSISNGELYSVLTNKAAKGGKGSLVAMVAGTKADDISSVFNKIPLSRRLEVQEVTLDFSSSMERAVRVSFPNARITTDRFHVQQLVSEALQEIRVSLRWKAIQEENEGVKQAKLKGERYTPEVFANADTKNNSLLEVATSCSSPRTNGSSANKKGRVFCLDCFLSLGTPTTSP